MKSQATDLNPTGRFSNRVSHYIRARPKYPLALLDFLRDELALTPSHRIADIGSGTGILSELLLANGNPVVGVEPNIEMRLAGEEYLRGFPSFQSLDGTAEATGLADHLVDFITAGQAFHWFDRPKTRVEFMRILRPDGWVVLVWNERQLNADGFDDAYDELVRRFAVEKHVDHHTTITGLADEVLGPFFGKGHSRVKTIENFQELNLDDVKARIMSSSYMPLPEHPRFGEMMEEAERSFVMHARGGQVHLNYDTRLYYGRMT